MSAETIAQSEERKVSQRIFNRCLLAEIEFELLKLKWKRAEKGGITSSEYVSSESFPPVPEEARKNFLDFAGKLSTQELNTVHKIFVACSLSMLGIIEAMSRVRPTLKDVQPL